jgi:hypothetical protein
VEPGRLILADREEISLGLHAREACAVIGSPANSIRNRAEISCGDHQASSTR